MKTKQKCWQFDPVLCVVVLVSLHLTSALPVTRHDSSKEHTCQSLFASLLDFKHVPYSTARELHLYNSQAFIVRNAVSQVHQDVIKLDKLKQEQICVGKCMSNCGLEQRYLRVVYGGMDETQPMLLIAPVSVQYSSSLLLKVSCEQQKVDECLNITFKAPIFTNKRLHRRAAISNHMTSEGSSHDAGEGGYAHTTQGIIGGAVVTVVGLLVLVSVVALCGGSNTYDTVRTSQKPSDDQVAVPASQPTAVNVEPVQKQNGNVSQDTPKKIEDPSNHKASSVSHDSLTLPSDPTSPTSSNEERNQRARTLSARSFDPLPEIPKLELAEDLPENVEADQKVEDENAYSYARVPGRNNDEMPDSDSSDEEDVDSPERAQSQSTGVLPYGKVTRAPTLDKDQPADMNTGDYAEVSGEQLGAPPLGKRDRSVTAPVEPSELGLLRDTRAYTESATHLPLPAIPRGLRPPVDDETMYDSIPDTMEGRTAKPAKLKPKEGKEQLYESVDEMGAQEDMYESFPEELKPDSPVLVTPIVLTPSSPNRPPFPPATVPPRPPESPLPTHRDRPLSTVIKIEESQGKSKKGEKKTLEKTVSSADHGEKKRAFSIFSRKKATSVSAGVGKSRKKSEKDVPQAKPHQHDPLPDLPPQTSPPHAITSPHPPSVPVPALYDDDEDMYDKPQLPLGKERLSSDSDALPSNKMTTEEAKSRAKSLPSGMRSAGASVFKFRQEMPLPEVPEDSGQGLVTVTHKRVLEEENNVATEPYDLVHISTPPPGDMDEPNYDTVKLEDILDPSSEMRREDPGYDKVGYKLDDSEQNENPARADDDESTSNSRGASPEGATVTGYGKVTRTSSPETESIRSGPSPDHDEVGYAVIPEMVKMRKRAMSAGQGLKQKVKSPDSQRSSTDDSSLPRAVSPSGSTDEQYAIIDIAAKRKRKQNMEQGILSPTERESGGASPIPPPLPPVGDLGDLSEFAQPPLPQRLEEVDHLVVNVENDSGYSRVLKVSGAGSSDPPYAKVKSKNDHPYAELDIGAALDGKSDVTLVDNEKRVGTPEATLSPSSPVQNEMSSGYDTVGDLKPTDTSVTSASVIDNTPKLETVDNNDENHMYDSLDPVSSPSKVHVRVCSPEREDEEAQNTYDVLENGGNETEDAEEPYEEIDEDTRQNLQKMHQQRSKAT